MPDENQSNPLGFLENYSSGSITPRKAPKKRVIWPFTACAIVMTIAAVGYTLHHEGIIIINALTTKPLTVPDVAKASLKSFEAPAQSKSDQPTLTPIPEFPEEKATPNEVVDRVEAPSPRPDPEAILLAQGLKWSGDLFVLEHENDAIRNFKSYEQKYELAHWSGEVLYNIRIRQNTIRAIDLAKQNINITNDQINAALDTLPRRCGPRENSLNSDQMKWHYLTLANRQDVNQLNWERNQIETDLSRNFPLPGAAQADFDRKRDVAKRELNATKANVEAIRSTYKKLGDDRSVTDAITEFNSRTGQHTKLGPSPNLSGIARNVKTHATYYD